VVDTLKELRDYKKSEQVASAYGSAEERKDSLMEMPDVAEYEPEVGSSEPAIEGIDRSHEGATY
jgi:hypothetical protein